MPLYEYACAACGPFDELQPMSAFAEPQPCPGCGAASPRAWLNAPRLSTMDGATRTAHATNERSAHAPRRSSHGPGCGCCGPKQRTKAPAAAKSFPAARPWMISH